MSRSGRTSAVRRRVVAALAAAALAGLAPLAAPAPQAVAEDAAAVPAVPTLAVAPDDGGVLPAGRALDIEVSVTNTGTTALPAGRLQFSIDSGPVASADYLLRRIADPPERLQGFLLPTAGATGVIAPGATQRIRVREGAADLDAALTAQSGTRLLYASFDNGVTTLVRDAAVTRMARGFTGRIGLGTVLPVTAPATTTGVVDVAEQGALTAPDGEWAAALRAAEADPAATVALDPAVPASIRLAGTAAPASATAFLTELAALPNEFVELPYGDADLTLERAAGASQDLAPGSFAGSTAAVPGTPASSAAPTPSPPATPPPTRSDLLAWDRSGAGLAWPVPGTTSAADLRLLGDGGRTVLLAAGDVVDSPARTTAGPAVQVGGTKALVADTTVSTLVSSASAHGTEGDAAMATLVGVLGTGAVTGTTAVLAVPARGTDVRGLDRVLSTLRAQPWISGRTLVALGSGRRTAIGMRSHQVPAARAATARALLAGERGVQDLGTAVQDSGALVGPERLALLGLLSARWRGDEAGWQAAAAAGVQRFQQFVGLVSITKSGSVLYTGDSSNLLINVVNELPEPVMVEVRGSSSNGRLQVTGSKRVRITVPGGTHLPAKLPIRSITNGRASVTVALYTPQGAPIGAPTTREITVQAGFEVIVAVTLIAALGLLFLTGIYRNVARQRRRLAARKDRA